MVNKIRVPFSRLPLRVRLTLWYLATISALLTVFSLFIYWQVQRNLVAQIDTALLRAAAQAQLNLEARGGALAFREGAAGDEVARRLGDDFAIYLLTAGGDLRDWLGRRDEFASQTPRPGLNTVAVADDLWRVYALPLAPGEIAPGSPGGWLQVAQEMDSVAETLAGLQAQLLLALPLALLLAGFGGFFLAGRALRPMEDITATARAIGAGDLSRRIGYRGPPDEVGRLAATVDNMLDRLETAFNRERRFTADAAHELRTPLTAIKGRIEVALSRPRSSEAYVDTLAEIRRQTERLVRLGNDLLFMARLDQRGGPAVRRERVVLAELLSLVVEQVRPLAAQKQIVVYEEVPPALAVAGDLELLIRLFLNLLDNAIKYTPPGGHVEVSAGKAGEMVEIRVRDTGSGIPAEHLPHLFDRFYRVEADRGRAAADGGAGLGLAIAAEIVRVHGGTIAAESDVGTGTTFTVRLPGGGGV